MRRHAGIIIAEVVKAGGVLGWTEIITQLIAVVENTDPALGLTQETQESAMEALFRVCEDNRTQLEKEYEGQRPVSILIPKFIQFTMSPLPKIRTHALSSINVFLPSKLQAVIIHVDSLLSALSTLARDPEEEVRKRVCRAFVFLAEMQPEKVAPHMGAIVDYMLGQQENADDEELALDAAEFWLTVGEHDQLKVTLGPYLDKILPVLLKSMVYSEEDIARLGGDEEDAHLEDRPEDIKPVFAKSKQRLPNGTNAEIDEDKTPGEQALDELSDGEIDDLDSDDELEGYDEDPEEKWNLRKCSAAALDVLSTVFHQTVFDLILPYLKESLTSSEWPVREASVLALGAVATGCLDAVTPHLPELVPFLLSLLNDPEPQVRQITCWTLGRYSGWASHLIDPERRKHYFEPMMEGILRKMLDRNKRVQEAAVSAFANLEEQSREHLTPYIQPIIRQFVTAMEVYKDRNMYILYDCVQTLAEHVGAALAQKELVDLLMPALINRWKKVKDDSRELFPLLECLSYVATALGHDFAPFAAPIFNRCIGIIRYNLEMNAQSNGYLDDKDFLVTSIDLLSAVIQALDSSSSELVANSQPPFFEMLLYCMQDSSADVRQSSYALLGDCAIYVFPQLQPYLPQIMGFLIDELDMSKLQKGEDSDTSYSSINNACWSCGEIALQQGAGMQPYVSRLYERLLQIIQSSNTSSSLTENAAIALGRLGLNSADELASDLESFAHPFLDALKHVSETDEKDTAFRGFVQVVGRNPQAMESCLAPFFKAIAKYEEPSPQLRELFGQVSK